MNYRCVAGKIRFVIFALFLFLIYLFWIRKFMKITLTFHLSISDGQWRDNFIRKFMRSIEFSWKYMVLNISSWSDTFTAINWNQWLLNVGIDLTRLFTFCLKELEPSSKWMKCHKNQIYTSLAKSKDYRIFVSKIEKSKFMSIIYSINWFSCR